MVKLPEGVAVLKLRVSIERLIEKGRGLTLAGFKKTEKVIP